MQKDTFAEHLGAAINAAHFSPRRLTTGECQSAHGQRCTLCHAVSITYTDEVSLKRSALQRFWNRYLSDIPLDPMVAAPVGRAYRTVTKRRVFQKQGRATIGLIDPSESGYLEAFEVVRCAIEPDGHAPIYATVRDYLSTAGTAPLAAHLRYVIIKGSTTQFTIIFHVREITHDIARSVNTLSKLLTRSCKGITALYLYEGDPTSGRTPRYYLEPPHARTQSTFRRVFGEKTIRVRICGREFSFSPLSFSQANQALFEQLIPRTAQLLDLHREGRLYDLYCGYGPFSLCLAGQTRQVIGVDASPEAIASAISNARSQCIPNARFTRSNISQDSLRTLLKGASQNDAALLDPPRNGTAPGVIEHIAAQALGKVVHIFCSIDLLPREIRRWRACGYVPLRAVPFDMFPGTSELEVAVFLEPK